MIFEKLILHNFGLYSGEQVLDLSPRQNNGKSSPIILFGGMNGGGKTTLLDAIKLALYGSRGNYSKRSNIAYDEFLRDSINRNVAASTGASVTLAFRITLDGEEHSYEVRRAWYQRGRTLRERLFVTKDGNSDQYLTEHWIDLVEEVIPLGVSQLFFFDAEQIRFLADDNTAQESLGSAIKSLLGLDLAERLITDASILEGRFMEQTSGLKDNPELTHLQSDLEIKEKELERKKEERAALENHRQRAENAYNQAEEAFANIGGKHWQERDARRQTQLELKNKQNGIELWLMQQASGALPLCLVPELLDCIRSQDDVEKQYAEQAIITRILAKRDRQILSTLATKGLPPKILTLIRKSLNADRRARQQKIDFPQRVALSETSRGQLHRLIDDLVNQLRRDTEEHLEQYMNIIRELESVEQSLAAIPNDSEVTEYIKQLQETTKELAILNDRSKRLDTEVAAIQSQRNDLSQKILVRRREFVERELASEQAARMVKLAIRTQSTMKEFLAQATASKIDRLSQRVTESFRFLLHKKTLVHQVQIDPTNFAITLFDNNGQPIAKHRLSEGEKQVFAISVLWGLAQSSPRPLPAIIDTPMARLDSEHRLHLVQRYFPNASHQVIVLSTDTEVDQNFYTELQSHIARAYHLDYDESEKTTVAREGYFWHSSRSNNNKRKCQ